MSVDNPNAASGEGPLAIICGGGSLPVAVAEAARRQGRTVMLFPLRGSADTDKVSPFPHQWARMAQAGLLFKQFRAAGCRDVVFIGSLIRPTIRQMRLDLLTLRLLPRIIRILRNGDDHLLSGVAAIFEEHGFRVLGAHEVAPEILMPTGALGHCRPSDGDHADIRRGLALLRATGPFDVGQAAAVSDNRVLAIEAAEGTDQMLMRLAELRVDGRIQARSHAGVLVKAPKPGQDRRFDLPTIGPKTVEGVAAAGLAGIAVVAGSAIVAEPDQIAAVADRLKIFVVGVSEDRPEA